MPNVRSIPEGYHSVTPYLYLKGATQAIEFYKKAFGAVEQMRMPGPDGTIGHAEIKIGDSIVMLADNPDSSPQQAGKTTVSFVIYFDDVEKVWPQAIAAGARELRPLEDKFYGDRMGMLADPFGHEWSLATHIEDVSPGEMQRRAQEEAAKMTAAG